jgi:PST family polysaccharide transporter
MAMETNIGSVYMAIGKPKILAFLFGFYVAILLPLIIILTNMYGVIGAAWACLIAGTINIPVYYTAMLRTLRLGVVEFLVVVWRPIVASILMYAAVRYYVGSSVISEDSLGMIPELSIAIVTGAVLYAGTLTLLWVASGRQNGPESAVINALFERVVRWYPAARRAK